jgi:hypothetical protein
MDYTLWYCKCLGFVKFPKEILQYRIAKIWKYSCHLQHRIILYSNKEHLVCYWVLGDMENLTMKHQMFVSPEMLQVGWTLWQMLWFIWLCRSSYRTSHCFIWNGTRVGTNTSRDLSSRPHNIVSLFHWWLSYNPHLRPHEEVSLMIVMEEWKFNKVWKGQVLLLRVTFVSVPNLTLNVEKQVVQAQNIMG